MRFGGPVGPSELHAERTRYGAALYPPREEFHTAPAGKEARGISTPRVVLSWFSHWRGHGGNGHAAGIWPVMKDDGVRMTLGPSASGQFPMLSDAQILGLLCEGSPEPRPTVEAGLAGLAALRLDADDPATLQRARDIALLFVETRWEAHLLYAAGQGASVGVSSRLPCYRAAMARLIAGVGPDLQPLPTRAVDAAARAYPQAALPEDGPGPASGLIFINGTPHVPAAIPLRRMVAPGVAAAPPAGAVAPIPAPAAPAEPGAPAGPPHPAGRRWEPRVTRSMSGNSLPPP